jgi:hypothetical protein
MSGKPLSILSSTPDSGDSAIAAKVGSSEPGVPLTIAGDDGRLEKIRRAAYARYEQRGFESGHEDEDWLAAEAEVNASAVPVSDKI